MSVILITGSSTGIGLTTAVYLSGKGHRVYASMRNPDRSAELRVAAEANNCTIAHPVCVTPWAIPHGPCSLHGRTCPKKNGWTLEDTRRWKPTSGRSCPICQGLRNRRPARGINSR